MERAQVWTHPFVIGELACGNLSRRAVFLNSLSELPQVPVVSHADVLTLVEARKLMGHGLGWIDMHVLTATMLSKQPFWTLDRRLAAAARELGVAAEH